MLPTASLTVAELLSGPFLLNVPVYQRPYSWGREHVEQFLEDVMEAAGLGASPEIEPNYFLGYILLMDAPGNLTQRISPKMSVREFDIVDGQQRLVTLTTLFSVLRDLDASATGVVAKKVQAITTGQQGMRFFRTDRPRITLSNRDRQFFEKYVLTPGACLSEFDEGQGELTQTPLGAVRAFLVAALRDLTPAQRATLFDYVFNKCHCVVMVSHDIDRAHRIFVILNERGKKLQRNDILKADVLSRIDTASLGWAEGAWEQASNDLGVGFEPFFGHLRTIYGQTKPQIVSGIRAIIRDAGGSEPFMRTVLAPMSAAYVLVRTHGDGVLPLSMQRRLRCLSRLSEADWAPAAMVALKDWRADPQAADTALTEIDRLAHLLRLLCMGSGKRARRFAPLIAALRNGETIDSSSPLVQISRDEVRNIAFHLNDLHSRDSKACKMLLMRLSEEMDESVAITADDYTIEHILPQRPSATSTWRRWFPVSEERIRLADSLGNLVLITQKQNEKAKNATFDAKKKIYGSPDGNKLMLPITADVMGNEEWHPADILAREERLIKIAETIWRLDLSTARRQSAASPATQEAQKDRDKPDRPRPN